MIPSVNDQKITTETFIPTLGKWPEWMCDCCGKFYGDKYYAQAARLPVEVAKPIYVEVKGIRYFACSPECGRILFNIHHQYAMREGDPAKRFGKIWTPDQGKMDLLDLDTVSRMSIQEWPEFYGPNAESPPPDGNTQVLLTWWTLDSSVVHQSGMPRSYATDMIEQWTSRPEHPPNMIRS